ncbi:hypothetical protein CMT75_18775 [Elizabethkingia anophelis]|nr:hypothetical protein [Elizabethkingia anophelis]
MKIEEVNLPHEMAKDEIFLTTVFPVIEDTPVYQFFENYLQNDFLDENPYLGVEYTTKVNVLNLTKQLCIDAYLVYSVEYNQYIIENKSNYEGVLFLAAADHAREKGKEAIINAIQG